MARLKRIPEAQTAEPRRRRFDPDRRMRIAAAAIAVVSKWGVEGLTHRRVAAEARVPLGSMTYHFSSLDDLLRVAIELAATRNLEVWRHWSKGLPPNADLPNELTVLLLDIFEDRKARTRTIVQFELYLAAMRRPALRELSEAWADVAFDAFIEHTDRTTARALALVMDSLAIAALVSGKPLSREHCLTMFRRVMTGARSPSSAPANSHSP